MYIHGVKEEAYDRVISNIKKAVEIKNAKNLDVTIGLQMVLMPEFEDQIIPLTKLGRDLGVDYLVIKHCSDDKDGTLGVDYAAYDKMFDTMKEAEAYSNDHYQVSVKWSKIQTKAQKCYKYCYGAPFIIQMSGSGLVAPCGSFFNDKYKQYHIGNIKEKRFKDIWGGERYWEVMKKISEEPFDANRDCCTLCLQHKTNEILWDIKMKGSIMETEEQPLPRHINFI